MTPPHLLGLNTPIFRAFLSAILLSFAQIELKITTTRLGETIKLFGSPIQFSMSLGFCMALFLFFTCIGVIFGLLHYGTGP